jgi:hypothetical protein
MFSCRYDHQTRATTMDPVGTADIKHFLVVYDVEGGSAEIREFGTDYDAARQAYAQIEREAWHRTDPQVMERVSITIGPLSFDHADYDADNDVLYVHVGEPRKLRVRRRQRATPSATRPERAASSV